MGIFYDFYCCFVAVRSGDMIRTIIFSVCVSVGNMELFSCKSNRDRSSSCFIELFCQKFWMNQKVSENSTDTKDLCDHGKKIPACSTCQIMIHATSV